MSMTKKQKDMVEQKALWENFFEGLTIDGHTRSALTAINPTDESKEAWQKMERSLARINTEVGSLEYLYRTYVALKKLMREVDNEASEIKIGMSEGWSFIQENMDEVQEAYANLQQLYPMLEWYERYIRLRIARWEKGQSVIY